MMVLLPLSFTFWRGIIWIPEMRGKGVPKIDFFLDFFSCAWVLEWVQKLVPIFFIIFGINFGFLFLGSWIFRVSFGSHLGPLEAFLRSLCSQKPLKNQWVFKGFWKWRFLVLWSSWWLFWAHLGPLGPLWSQTGFQHKFQHLSTKFFNKLFKNRLKNVQVWALRKCFFFA